MNFNQSFFIRLITFLFSWLFYKLAFFVYFYSFIFNQFLKSKMVSKSKYKLFWDLFIFIFLFAAESVMAGFVKKCPCLRPPTEEIHVLDYRHNSLSDLPTEVFNLERTLEELYVDNNQLRDLPRVGTITCSYR